MNRRLGIDDPPRITLADVGAGLAMVATCLLVLMVFVALTAVPE